MEFSRPEYWSGLPFPSPMVEDTNCINLGLSWEDGPDILRPQSTTLKNKRRKEEERERGEKKGRKEGVKKGGGSGGKKRGSWLFQKKLLLLFRRELIKAIKFAKEIYERDNESSIF